MNKRIIIATSDNVILKLKVLAKEKEDVRRKLVVTAKKLALKAVRLAVIAKEKENIRRKLAVTAEKLKELRTTLEKKVIDRTKDLEQAKAKDEAILASLGDGLAVADQTGKLVYFNKAAEQITGLGMAPGSPDTWQKEYGTFEVDTLTSLSTERTPLVQALKGKTVFNMPLFLRNKKIPQGKYISVTATPIVVGGKNGGAVAIFRDMTKEREIDQAKTEFVSLASHQLRTPLSTVSWYSEMLLTGDVGKLNEGQKKYLEEIYRGNQRMVELVNALLNVSRIELGTFVVEPKLTNIVKLTQSVIEEQKPQINQKKLKFNEQYVDNLPKLNVDPKLLRMVVQNILSNAVKYTPEGGKIELAISLVDKKNIQIKISDTGYGIPKNQQDKIFTKLFRADNVREKDTEGTGLGLYIVKSIIEHSGGKVWFESTENKGTTFFVTLPLSFLDTLN